MLPFRWVGQKTWQDCGPGLELGSPALQVSFSLRGPASQDKIVVPSSNICIYFTNCCQE